MSNHATYPLETNGAVRHWLASGPSVTPIPADGALAEAFAPSGPPFGERGRWTLNYWAWDARVQAAKSRIYEALDPALDVIDPAPTVTGAEGDGMRWRYLAPDDDTADFSRFSHTPALFSGHLYTEIVCDEARPRDVELITIGPAHLWLDGRLVHHHRRPFSYVHPYAVRVSLPLDEGVHGLWLRGDMIGLREARLALGLRFLDPAGLNVRVPIGDRSEGAWHEAERCVGAVQVSRFVVEEQEAAASVAAGAGSAVSFTVTAELASDPPIRSHLGTFTAEPGQSVALPLARGVRHAVASTLSEGRVDLVIRPATDLPLERRYEVVPALVAYRDTPYGSYESRRREALAHLARMDADVLGSAAAVRLGHTPRIAREAVATSLRFLNERRDTADFHALGLLAVVYWFADSPALDARDLEAIRDAFRHFKYWLEEPGLDAMCYFTENHQILFHASEYLAAQRWPDLTFSNSGITGAAKLPAARSRILAWIERRLRSGFSEWDSNAYLAMDAFALLALVEFADEQGVSQRARSLLDKLFFMLAAQSFRGTQGCTHGRCYVGALRSGRNDATAGLQRLAWGTGTFNSETRAPGLLAMSERYRVPDVIQAIGADLPEALVTYAHARGDFLPEADMRADGWDVRTLTRRTPDYQLAAALDHRPGAMGIQEHLWQATLGPEAVVFTTYPGNRLEHGQARPNFWAGSARLPQVGMHGRTVLCLYRLDDAVGLGFTHAYFPVESFDVWSVEGAWAFARHGSGYVALWGDGPLALTEEGRFARQELRSRGAGLAWLCTVGSAAEDGTFQAFCERLREGPSPVAAEGPRLSWRPADGSELTLGWLEGLQVDGALVDTAAFQHYHNRYTRTELGDAAMVLEHAGLRHVIPLRFDGAGPALGAAEGRAP